MVAHLAADSVELTVVMTAVSSVEWREQRWVVHWDHCLAEKSAPSMAEHWAAMSVVSKVAR